MSLNLFIMRKVLNKICEENKNTYFISRIFLRKSCRLRVSAEKYGGAREAAAVSMTARCMLD
jgi:hypothetical protein